jgi:hypothetical protein
MNAYICVSIGELWDKYTILLIKKNKVKDQNKLKYIETEINYLQNEMNKYLYEKNKLFLELQNINETLWDIEDKLRIKESSKTFDNEFIELARQVYYTNDKRAEIKNQINIEFNSSIYEIKNYINYSK